MPGSVLSLLHYNNFYQHERLLNDTSHVDSFIVKFNVVDCQGNKLVPALTFIIAAVNSRSPLPAYFVLLKLI